MVETSILKMLHDPERLELQRVTRASGYDTEASNAPNGAMIVPR